MSFEPVSAKSLDSYVGRPGCLIIDVRDGEDFAKGHIYGAYNLPYERLEWLLERAEKAKNTMRFRQDVVYVIYCERGSASLAAAKLLAEKGYHAKSVVGGIRAYRGRYLV